MISHLEPDILECEVKWALGSITTNKASGGNRIPVDLFQILQDDVVKVCTQYASKFGKLGSGYRTRKGQFSFQFQRKAVPKNAQTAHISHASKVMLKIFQARLQQYMNFQMFKLDLEKTEEAEIKLSTSAGSSKKQKSSRKTFTSVLLTMSKPLTVWTTTNCGKFLKRWEYQTP